MGICDIVAETLLDLVVEMFDLTKKIRVGMDVYPGDPVVTIHRVKSIENDGFNLSSVSLSNHTGTHIDFPSHVIQYGMTINDYPLDYLCGEGLILDFTNDNDFHIFREKFYNKQLLEKDILLIKHSRKSNDIHIDSDAIKFLCEKNIKIIGTETHSIDTTCSNDLSVHKSFLRNDILILENLDLSMMEEGRYKIYIFPMKLDSLDGSPCRVGAERC